MRHGFTRVLGSTTILALSLAGSAHAEVAPGLDAHLSYGLRRDHLGFGLNARAATDLPALPSLQLEGLFGYTALRYEDDGTVTWSRFFRPMVGASLGLGTSARAEAFLHVGYARYWRASTNTYVASMPTQSDSANGLGVHVGGAFVLEPRSTFSVAIQVAYNNTWLGDATSDTLHWLDFGLRGVLHF